MENLIGREVLLSIFSRNYQFEKHKKEEYICIIKDVWKNKNNPNILHLTLDAKDNETKRKLISKPDLNFNGVILNGVIDINSKKFLDDNDRWTIMSVTIPQMDKAKKESKIMATPSSSSSSKTAPKSACEKVTETGREVAKIAFGNAILEKGSSEIIKRLPPIIRGYAEDYKPIFELALSMVLSKGVEMYMHDNEKAEVIMECVEKAAIARSATMISNVAMKFLSGIEIPDALKK